MDVRKRAIEIAKECEERRAAAAKKEADYWRADEIEIERLTARLTVLAGVLREVHEIASNWDEEGRQRCQRIIEIVAGALGAERA